MIICKECNSLHFSNGHVVTSNVDHNYIVGLNDKYKELPKMETSELGGMKRDIFNESLSDTHYDGSKVFCLIDQHHTIIDFHIEGSMFFVSGEKFELLKKLHKYANASSRIGNVPHVFTQARSTKILSIDFSLLTLEEVIEVKNLFLEYKRET